jgi:hypothetical protein
VPSSVGVAFRIVMAMKQHFAGEARAALLAAMTANMRPKIVIVVDPDIDVHGPVQVDSAPGLGGFLVVAGYRARDRLGERRGEVGVAAAVERRQAVAEGDGLGREHGIGVAAIYTAGKL